MMKWSKVVIKIVAAVLGFVFFVWAIEWFTVKQYDWDIWLLSHRAETRFEEEAGRE